MADTLLIYIAEAHAVDEWPAGDHLRLGRKILQPKALEERLVLAKTFVHEYGLGACRLLVDDPGLDSASGFSAVYAAWPTRFYIVKGGEILWIAQPNKEHLYDDALAELEHLAKGF